ncbi:DUF2306 domain-containing protein [Nonomuraea candida]|uniref:DUF2306 domain-containing protein n=1 Tax=Nonomuraea candida TaxID=359159 RepID=UPI0005B801F4|nr:DUF2306 domain-containing protein [Nonomuraea candida]
MRTTSLAGRLIPAGLITLSFVPLLAGAVRLTEFAGGVADDRHTASALPLTVHIVTVTLYSLAGAFQFAPGFRRRRPRWHRAAGRALVGAGMVAALSGVWLTLFSVLPPGDAGLPAVFRVVFGTGMFASLALGLAAARRRDLRRHRAWMMRAYAVGLGAGTQAFTQGAWIAAAGPPDDLTRAWLLGAAWLINLAVAERLIRRRPRAPRRSRVRRRRSEPDAAGLVRPHGDLDPVADPELGHQARDVTLHRAQ